jgi:hypothetical protein
VLKYNQRQSDSKFSERSKVLQGNKRALFIGTKKASVGVNSCGDSYQLAGPTATRRPRGTFIWGE